MTWACDSDSSAFDVHGIGWQGFEIAANPEQRRRWWDGDRT